MDTRKEISTDELIASTLGMEAEDPDRWDNIWILQDRAGDEVFAAAERLTEQEHGPARQLGVDILAQGLVAKKSLRDRAVSLLLDLAAREQDPVVIVSLCYAFGHLHDPAAIDTARRWASHPDENVRFGVVHALSGYDDPRAIETLIQLSTDDDCDMRDWATFGLGTQIDTDTPAIRDALRARLDDLEGDSGMEALAGLARRCEPGVVPALQVLLADMDVDHLPLGAGLPLADPIFHGALIRLASLWERQEMLMNVIAALEEAIKLC